MSTAASRHSLHAQLKQKHMEWWYFVPVILAVVMFLLVGTVFEKKIETAIRSFVERRLSQLPESEAETPGSNPGVRPQPNTDNTSGPSESNSPPNANVPNSPKEPGDSNPNVQNSVAPNDMSTLNALLSNKSKSATLLRSRPLPEELNQSV